MSDYTPEQRQELTRLFATVLHEFLVMREDGPITDFVNKLYVETAKLPWFAYRGNVYGILSYLEANQVYGAFEFFLGGRVSLYLRANFRESFQAWARKRPPLDKFLRAWPKSRARKPTEEEVRRLEKRCYQINPI